MTYLLPTGLIDRVKRGYCRRQVALVAPLLSPHDRVLDFGCGDGSLADGLAERLPGLEITGVDVVESSRPARMRFVKYAGSTLPFEDGAFDVVLAYHVFHHCSDPEAALRECCRVARRRIVMIEPTVRSPFDLPAMRFTDWLFNAWKPEPVPLPYHFQRRARWRQLLEGSGFSIEQESTVGMFPAWLPIGRTLLFSASRSGLATSENGLDTPALAVRRS